MRTAYWPEYLSAMRDHLAHNERLAERLRYFVADERAMPLDLSPRDFGKWLALLVESEEFARRHRAACEALLNS